MDLFPRPAQLVCFLRMSASVRMLGSWDKLEEGKLENIFVAEGGFRE